MIYLSEEQKAENRKYFDSLVKYLEDRENGIPPTPVYQPKKIHSDKTKIYYLDDKNIQRKIAALLRSRLLDALRNNNIKRRKSNGKKNKLPDV